MFIHPLMTIGGNQMWLNSFSCIFKYRRLSSVKNKMFLRWTHFSSSNSCQQIHLPVDTNVQIQFSAASAASLYERKPLKCWVSGVPFHLSSEKFQFTCIYIRQLTWEDPSLILCFTQVFLSFILRRATFSLIYIFKWHSYSPENSFQSKLC